MKTISRCGVMVCVALACLHASAVFSVNDFRKLYRDGARACMDFCITDDRGVPVQDAKVDVFFDIYDRSKGTRVIANTDSNGLCRVEGRTRGVLEIEVTKDGYYRTRDRISLITMGRRHEVKWGKWQPWGMKHKIILPKVRERSALPFKSLDWRWTKHINEWIGYDLQLGDYVAPFGSGEVVDFEIYFAWDGKLFNDFNEIEIRLRFPDKYAGVYWADKFIGSDLKGVYTANATAKYNSEISFGSRVFRDKKGIPYKRETRDFDKSKTLVGRSRCALNESGELVQTTYFQIYYMTFACDDKGVAIRCGGFYNPTPNDTNLEPKR